MKYIVKTCGAGKTYDLIHKYFLKMDSVLLVSSELEKKRIIKQYNISQRDSKRIITWYQAKEKLRGINKPVLIDNVNHFLFYILRRMPYVVTFNGYNHNDE